MSFNDKVDDAKNAVKKVAADTGDALHEAGHRSTAEAERARRDVAGDDMTLSEKAGSVVNEATNRTQAEIDAAKRSVRDHT